MTVLLRRAGYDKVGDYLYSEDLCVGVFDGTNYNSGTCTANNLTSSDARFPTSSMIIRDNTVKNNYEYVIGAVQNLTQVTQAQCVMTGLNTTACWVWDSGFQQCYSRTYYELAKYVRTDSCSRTKPIESNYSVIVRRSDFHPVSAAAPRTGGTLKRLALVGSLALALMFG
ncbi:hypothetical protein IW146_006635 [Coemansia sp. RSA 922]|nr:hypothetical protein LPJ71_000747 [Coemansia sp. S17]KAJ2044141.1 hypothetical protein H4S04_006380 [Coemansia sp. S16]KAJ2066009.1 hypothetical protein GGI08_002081 [Coemansia sp. S2]KAJ2073969.1 hypothetical protein GGH13_001631 [Coemansia sp. S155-1]KAJ2108865.1 hypothetical protein IW146_006635 [Coemansia sp. RSA 922]KAJ2423579.1 hypothetical protein GGF41_003083 [Coemansia sp. RSA 2531]